ncbi:hypothetical protein ABLB84_14485, partial [Xenorhabdus szentirmaii]|uniref:hypothetical protein n=1 Tax=Xenorhabdus szentirmaii TaxID=290112 RepID=UPI0032B7BCBF
PHCCYWWRFKQGSQYRRSTYPARPKPPPPEPPLNGRVQAHWQKHPTSGLIITGLRIPDYWILPIALSD